MHDIGLNADIRYADILQLIWPIIDIYTHIYVYFFLTPNCRALQVSSVVDIVMQTLNVLARQQMQA